MTDQPHKRITIDAPDSTTILAARHLDATEGRVQVGTTVDSSTRAAITRVLDYVARAHNSPAAPADTEKITKLTAECDEARQHAAAIAGQRDRLRQRMNALADRWENALAVDKPYAYTLRSEISIAPFHGEHTAVQQYRADDGGMKWAARCWGTETCDGWLSLDHDVKRWAEIARDRHVAEEHGGETPEAGRPTAPCAGFPDRCSNPVDVPARSPYHGGGTRCGCTTKEA